MVARLKRSGNQYMLALPREVVEQLAADGVRDQVPVEVSVEGGAVILRPSSDSNAEPVKQISEKVMTDYDSALKRLAK